MQVPTLYQVGLVAIGRNEGPRLVQCLHSVIGKVAQIVYVDSGSTDDSVAMARSLGVLVISLDLSRPFTAARARNAGLEHLLDIAPMIELVQFVDGDCEIIPGWIEAAVEALDDHSNVVAVCGWVKERNPERSIYNRICSVEWLIGSLGLIPSFAGNVMIRVAPLLAVGGYDASVIAAEDDELSVRLQQQGGQILRIDQDCLWHDSDMRHFSQWWNRAKRCGYAYAQVSRLHGAAPEHKFRPEIKRLWLWGGIVPGSLIVLALLTSGLSLVGLLRYPLVAFKVAVHTQKQGFGWYESIAWGISCAVSVFPGLLGLISFWLTHWRGNPHVIIEHKATQMSPKGS
jgi:glycosyltransferase involved in cell wall biosynthesis